MKTLFFVILTVFVVCTRAQAQILVDSIKSTDYEPQILFADEILNSFISQELIKSPMLPVGNQTNPRSLKMVKFINEQFKTEIFANYNVAKYTQFKAVDSFGTIAFQIFEIGFKRVADVNNAQKILNKYNSDHFKVEQLTVYRSLVKDRNVIFLITQTTQEKRIMHFIKTLDFH